jgi:hypothetical protein
MRGSALSLLATACALAASTFACSTDPTFSEASGGAGASAGAGSVGTATGGGAATSTGSGSGAEDCTNGVDDDGDGDVDCADSDCTGAGFSCAPVIPPGWSGPAVLYTGDDEPPACSADWNGGGAAPIQGGVGVDATAPTCSACTCGAATNVVCGPTAPLAVEENTQCTNPQDAPIGTCFVPPGAPIVNARLLAGPVETSGGACAPSGGVASVSPAAFTTRASTCAAPTTGVGCGAGVCAPKVPAGYGAPLCIQRAGDVACPVVDYTEKTLVYGTIADTRGCNPCQCSAPVGGACDATLQVYTSSSNCSGGSNTFPATGNCYGTGKDVTSAKIQAGAPFGAKCTASGGTPTGAALGAEPTTVCCEPG